MTRGNSYLTESTFDVYKAQSSYYSSLSNHGRFSKIDDDEVLFDTVVNSLIAKESPEVIANKIKSDTSISTKISAKTIYNSVYNGSLGLSNKILPYGKRRNRKAYKKEKSIIKPNGGLSIDLRPDISDRVEFGHFKIDCLVGTSDVNLLL